MKQMIPLLALLVILAGGCDKADSSLDEVLFTVPSFSLTNHENQPFGSEQLKGKTWIATLFFTTCPGPCPMMTGRLRDIQAAVNDPDVRLVSISCDPEKDTPETLKQYATNVGADPNRWFFLTGDPAEVKAFAEKGLKLHYAPGMGDQPIEHSTRFLLIDGDGGVRGIYDTEDDASMAQLKTDAAKLARR